MQSAFFFITKVFSGVKLRALCRLLEFFHTMSNYVFMDLALFIGACHATTNKNAIHSRQFFASNLLQQSGEEPHAHRTVVCPQIFHKDLNTML